MLLQVLTTFAGAWGSLGRIGETRRVLYIGLSHAGTANGVLRFIAVEQRPGQIVIADVALLEPLP
ncbi:MAG: hypothetical protein OES13_08445 [Acidimicrobiia bacterium]|nr:hypothetical protein [Acidimicrobiia bacterium]